LSEKDPRSGRAIHTPVFLYALSLGFIGFILPIYSKALGANALEIGGLFSAFTLTTLILRPFTGWALDRFGRRPLFLSGLLLFACSRLAYVAADTIARLYMARFTGGLGALILSVSVVTIVADLAPPDERGREMGTINGKMAKSSLLGAFLGFGLYGALPRPIGWQVVFFGYTAMAIVAVWIGWRGIPETKPERIQHLQGPLNRDAIPAQLVKLMFIVFMTGASTSMLSPIYIIYLQDKFTADFALLGAAFLPGALAVAFLSPSLGALSDRFGRTQLMVIGLVSAGALSCFIPLLPSLAWLAVLFAMVNVAGAASGPAQTAMVSDIIGTERRGRGYGLYDLSLNLGATIGPLLGGLLYDAVGKAIPFYLNGITLLTAGIFSLLFLGSPVHHVEETATDQSRTV